jgi:hypothetical protein
MVRTGLRLVSAGSGCHGYSANAPPSQSLHENA